MRTTEVTGEVCAPATWYSVAGDLYRVVADGTQTSRAYALTEAIVTPGNGPPPHVHTREAEGFYVLSGTVNFFVAGREHTLRAGEFLAAPAGIEHRYVNPGPGPARLLVWIQPAGFEEFFREVGTPLTGDDLRAVPMRPEAAARLVAVAERYGVTVRVGE